MRRQDKVIYAVLALLLLMVMTLSRRLTTTMKAVSTLQDQEIARLTK